MTVKHQQERKKVLRSFMASSRADGDAPAVVEHFHTEHLDLFLKPKPEEQFYPDK